MFYLLGHCSVLESYVVLFLVAVLSALLVQALPCCFFGMYGRFVLGHQCSSISIGDSFLPATGDVLYTNRA